MIRLLPGLFLVFMSFCSLAQSDPLTSSDTIGVSSQRGRQQAGAGYSYYGAGYLTSSQLKPIFSHSPDSMARTLYEQSRRLNWVASGLNVASLALFVGSLTTVGRRSGPNGALFFAGIGALGAGFIPRVTSSRRLAAAISSHNNWLRTSPQDYAPPVVYAPTREWILSLADTISKRRQGLRYRYTYRGIEVYPGTQLGRLTASLNDHEVNQGLHYIRTINGIGGVVGSIGRGLLTGYVAGLLLSRNRRFRGGSTASLSNEFLTTGLICVGANFVLSRHASRVQQRWVDRYNELIVRQFQSR